MDWHEGAAFESGHPAEGAGIHIGQYLGWLARRDMLDAHMFAGTALLAVREGRETGSTLLTWSDGKLLSDLMTAAGATFTSARYRAYVERYDDLVAANKGLPLPDDAASADLVAEQLDAMYVEWVKAGRPDADRDDSVQLPPEVVADIEAQVHVSMDVAISGAGLAPSDRAMLAAIARADRSRTS